jgi:tRNA 2-selenouridine synthase
MTSPEPQSSPLKFKPGNFAVTDVELDQIDSTSIYIDVRAPVEFEQDHIPGAVNVPLLQDHERMVVGTLYRVEGPDSATRWATEAVHSRITSFLRQLTDQIDDARPIVICCARGGNRSGNVVQFLEQHGIRSRRLVGGYRSYRKRVMSMLEQIDIAPLWVLDGLTGAGKTNVLHHLKDKYPDRILDLEGYAGHRSSRLGDVGLVPKSQKEFESLLAQAYEGLDRSAPWILIEGESRKVGNREIPQSLWQQMQQAPRLDLVLNIEERAQLLVEEYRTTSGWGDLIDRIDTLRCYEALGDQGVDEIQSLLKAGEPQKAAVMLLEKHYDPRYVHGNKGRHYHFRVEQPTTAEAALEIVRLLSAESS